MKTRDLTLLLVLGAMWGSSFLFLKVAVAEVEPAFVVACRLFFAVSSLLLAAPLLRRLSGGGAGLLGQGLRVWPSLVVLGLFNAALPFLAISWGTQFLTSGTAAIMNSTVPLFTALLAGVLPFFASERLGALGVAGILLGIVGVGVLVDGSSGSAGGGLSGVLLGAVAVSVGSASYAMGGLFARRAMGDVPVAVSAVGQSAGGLVLSLPLAAVSVPERVPSLPVIGSLVGLGVIGTGFSLLIYFRLIASVGATRTSTVTYLVPVWALLYGALLLGEPVTARSVLGLILILAGVAGVSGMGGRLPRKTTPEGTPDGP